MGCCDGGFNGYTYSIMWACSAFKSAKENVAGRMGISAYCGYQAAESPHAPSRSSYPIHHSVDHASYNTATIKLRNKMIAAPSCLLGPEEGHEITNTSGTDKRRPVRRDHEKRRQQNMNAQKKYREKLKRRLDHLETLAAAVADGVGMAEATTPDAGAIATRMTPSVLSKSTTTDDQSVCHYMGQGLNDFSNESAGFSELDLSASISLHSFSDVTPCDTVGSIDPSHLMQNMEATSRLHPWVDYVECGCLSPHVQASATVGLSKYRDLKVLNVNLSPFPVDPCDNTLRVERICIVQAVTANRLHIGITEEMLCQDDAISPFFRPFSNSIGDSGSDGVVRTMQTIFKSLKPDLRPIKEQIMIRHHPIIDLLPFPTLRKNLITNKNAIHNQELFYDLISGLVCWGGVGRRDDDSSTSNISTSTSWDGRSWEARIWFLQKYWVVLGGEEGELVRQSEWWRNMRGEETSLGLGA